MIAETVLADLDAPTPAVAARGSDVDPSARSLVGGCTSVGDVGSGVEVGDLITTQSHPVLTRGHGDSVVVPLTQVGSADPDRGVTFGPAKGRVRVRPCDGDASTAGP